MHPNFELLEIFRERERELESPFAGAEEASCVV
jgi:hypothetical protein